jgi:hypothetical protein
MGSGSGGSGVRLVPVERPGGVRWLTHLSPARAAAYASSVAPAVPAIERALGPVVVANRVVALPLDPPAIVLEPWRSARARFSALVGDLALGSKALLLADVRGCYAAITAGRVREALARLGCDPGIARHIAATVRGFERAGVVGLPVGPEGSAVLANAVLAHVDASLERAGFRHLRWVDDVMVGIAGASSAERALRVIERALGEVGLEVATQKTRIVDASCTDRSDALPASCSPIVDPGPMDG